MANEDTKYKVDVDKKDLNQEQGYKQALDYNNIAAQDANNRLMAGNQEASRISAENYDKKLNSDYNQAYKLALLNRGSATSPSGGSSSSSSSSTSFGLGAAAPSGYSSNVYGQKSLFDASGVADWQNRQGAVLNQQIGQAQRLSDVDTQKQNFLAGSNQNRAIDMMNRQSNIDAQVSNANYAKQSEQAALERQSREKIASTQAQSGIFGGLFNSLSSGSQNYRFWN